MKRKTEKANWFNDLAKGSEDLSTIQPIARKPLLPPPPETMDVPPFKGISREPLLSKQEAMEKLGCCVSHIDKQLRLKMIFPQPRGSRVMFPIEEIENYLERERLRYMKRYA